MVRLSKEEALRLGLIAKPKSKYHNNKVTYYDPDYEQKLTFDSKKEFEYYLILKDRLKKGDIFRLERQKVIYIQPRFKTPDGKTVREITYKADFVYLDSEGVTHIVDVKGFKTDVYKLKKKLLAYKGFYIEEV